MDATSIISGMSSEKPADDRVRWIEYIWSAYEVTGDDTMLLSSSHQSCTLPKQPSQPRHRFL